jgi:CheY-like chemotaxis protein
VSELTREQFLLHLRAALNHLRDPNYLRQSPLAAAFDVGQQPDTPAALRNVLIAAVRSLKPTDDEPPQSRAWRLYESLYYRHVQCFSQLEVAEQLGISIRQVRREQHDALEALTHQLWEQFDVGSTDHGSGKDEDGARQSEEAMDSAADENLAWLKDAPPEHPVELDHELPAVLDLAGPLAAQHGVRLAVSSGDGLPRLAANPIAFRQMLLSLLSVAISHTATGSFVEVIVRLLAWEAEIRVRAGAVSASPPAARLDDEASGLDLAHQLTDLCGGKLSISSTEEAFETVLILPTLGQSPVLAIDDNAGTLQLLTRYTAGTRYRLVSTQDPDRAIDIAKEISPQVIVLDVMMPYTDGWELVGRLRQDPATAHIPIVVCTILPHEQLARSLGANGFLRKPVTRQAFLSALDRHVTPIGSSPR